MALPKIDLPIFETKLPSTGETIKFRQYNVKEEKIFLTALESDDPRAVAIALRQVIGNCILNMDVDDLALFDVEHLLMRIRAVSVNNEMTFYLTDQDTGEQVEVVVNAEDVQVTVPDGHSDLIHLNDTVSLKMKYPSWQSLEADGETFADDISLYLMSCIDQVIAGDQVTKISDVSEEELETFFNDLSSDMVSKLEQFFTTMPTLNHTINYKLKDGTEKSHTFTGLNSFFL